MTTSFSSNESILHPVAAVLGMSRNPVTYVAPKASSIIRGFSGSDSDNSSVLFVSTKTPSIATVVATPLTEVAPLHCPHLYWKCVASGKTNEFLIIFDALIDHSSSAVLISEEYVSKLGRRQKCFPNLILQSSQWKMMDRKSA